MQLVAYGAQDVYLTGNPQITFFKVVYRRHTNFSMECIEQPVDSAKFGGMHTVQVLRNGDLAGKMYLMTTLPALNSLDAADPKVFATDNRKVAWVKRVGHALIDNIECTVGGSQVDKHYGMWYDLWYELTHTHDQERGYKKMIGDVPELTNLAYRHKAYTLYVPLQFWFNRNTGLALPLIALQYHEVRFNIKLQSKDNLIVKQQNGTTDPTVSEGDLSDSALLVDYIYLDSEERRRFAQVGHEYLIEQVQFGGVESLSGPNSKVKLDFNHPCKELVWVVQSGIMVKQNTSQKYLVNHEGDESATLAAAAQKLAWGMVANAAPVNAGTVGTDGSVGANSWVGIKANAGGDVGAGLGEVEIISAATSSTQVGYITVQPTVAAPASNTKFTFVVSVVNANNAAAREYQGEDLWVAMPAGGLQDSNGKNICDAIKEVTINITAVNTQGAFTTWEVSAISLSDVTVTRHELTMADISLPIGTNSNGFVTDRRSTNKADVDVLQPFNYGLDLAGNGTLVNTAKLQLNGHDRFDEREGAYFNYVQPAQHHTRTPAGGVNVYSFGLHPEQHQPSGTANLSRIDTTLLWLHLRDSLRTTIDNKVLVPAVPQIKDATAGNNAWIFAFSYNVFRIMSGMGGLAYAN